MPADLNRVTLVGRLTRDPELRHTQGGDPVCSIRLAVSSRARDETGSWGDRSNYFDITVFGRQAETASTYLAKGRRIGVDGRLSWREWQAQDGSKRQSVEVIAGDVFFLDSRADGGASGEGGGSQQGAGWSAPAGGGDLPVGAAAGNGGGAGAGAAADDDAEVPF
jgi:single-strand DNA-binding protein